MFDVCILIRMFSSNIKGKEVGDLKVIDFNEETVVMQHSILNGEFIAIIICNNYMSEPEYDFYLYDGNTLIGKNGVEGIFDIDLDITLIKHGGSLKSCRTRILL